MRFLLGVVAICATTNGLGQSPSAHKLVPLKASIADIGFEVLSGDPDKAGSRYVIRIQNDPGFVVLPHTHAEDENIVVVKGSWSVAMGSRVIQSALSAVEIGDYAFVPKRMPHFGWARSEVVVQIHGIGPFSTDFVDTVFALSASGVAAVTVGGRAGSQVAGAPPGCFTRAIGDTVRNWRGIGTVIRGLCSPPSRFTQYQVRAATGARWWVAADSISAA